MKTEPHEQVSVNHQEKKLSYLNFGNVCIVNQIPTGNTSIIVTIEAKAGICIH